MKAVTIEPLRPEDQDAARTLILNGLAERWGDLDENKNPDLNDIARAYAAGLFLVARREEEVIGTGAFRPLDGDTVEVVRMSVRADLRRRGIGRAILTGLCRRARCRGYRRVILETTATWHDAIAFYRAFGFRVTHRVAGDVYFALDLESWSAQE